jgi:PadR family transcriptional regulator, regulatory protein PadR
MQMKGVLPLLILHCLAAGPAHGYAIARAIKQRSREVLDFKEGTLYPALHLLEEQAAIESAVDLVDGRQRRCYRLTEAGRAALARERAAWARYTRAVEQVLGATA